MKKDEIFGFSEIIRHLCIDKIRQTMTYNQQAKLELLNAMNCIQTESELKEFRNMLAHYFAQKAEKEIDGMWDKGLINEDTIEQWGKEHMRTPYKYAKNRS